jgi:4a-hydroxytetrahydrobiopterin dehydratase
MLGMQEESMTKLTQSEIDALLAEQMEWRLEDGALVRDWEFRDFVESILFVNRIAALAEDAGHHPDIDIRYNKVRLTLTSHDAGGLTERDAAMVSKLDGEF